MPPLSVHPIFAKERAIEEAFAIDKKASSSSQNQQSNVISLNNLLKRADVWQGSKKTNQQQAISTGYSKIDQLLHYQGWPLHRLTEILLPQLHIGEMTLVLPSIAKQLKFGGALFLIEPPFTPYAPAWLNAGIDIQQIFIIKSCQEKDWLWATEQVMANKGVGCCLFWPPKDYLSNKVLKRLQLATQQGSALNFIFRQAHVANQFSPASLRLKLQVNEISQTTVSHDTNSYGNHLAIQVLKQQGGWSGQQCSLQLGNL